MRRRKEKEEEKIESHGTSRRGRWKKGKRGGKKGDKAEVVKEEKEC